MLPLLQSPPLARRWQPVTGAQASSLLGISGCERDQVQRRAHSCSPRGLVSTSPVSVGSPGLTLSKLLTLDSCPGVI